MPRTRALDPQIAVLLAAAGTACRPVATAPPGAAPSSISDESVAEVPRPLPAPVRTDPDSELGGGTVGAAGSALPIPEAARAHAPDVSSVPEATADTRVPSITLRSSHGEHDAIRAQVKARLPAFRRCYDDRPAATGPELQGRLAVGFLIQGDGSVTALEHETEDLDDATMLECIGAVFERMHFAPPPGGGTIRVTYPMVFRPD
jgi:hypothetical protein